MRSTSIGSSCLYGVLHDGCSEPRANPTLLKMKHLINIIPHNTLRKAVGLANLKLLID